MLEVQAFEEAFQTFIDITYQDVHDGHKWKYTTEQRLANYDSLLASLLALLATLHVAYDDFIEQELAAWATTTVSNGNPLALPFTQLFVPQYSRKDYKGSFLYICLQSKAPEKDISTALIQACYFEVQGNLEACYGIYIWLEFLAEYPPNPAAVEFIAYILPHVNEDWYSQELACYLPYLLERNPEPEATALLAQWKALEAKIETARRL